MNIKFLKYLACPKCKGDLFLESGEKKTIILNDILTCKSCNNKYSINNGIPRLVDKLGMMKTTKETFSEEWKFRHNGFFEKKLSSGYSKEDRYKKVIDKLEVNEKDLYKKLFLDAGCGDGEYGSEIAKNNPQTLVFLADISDGVRYTKQKLQNIENSVVIQCDLMCPPFKNNTFDFIWSDGVLHHTPNTFEAFCSVEKLVKSRGKFYAWLYPNYTKSYYLFIRDLLIKPYLLPSSILYLISIIFSIPFWIFCKFFNMYKIVFSPKTKHLLKKRTFLSIAFSLYDSISPTYQFRHGKKEVEEWFSSKAYENIKIVGDLAVVGTKKNAK